MKALSTADLDGDGDLDVLSTGRYSNAIVWYENLGDGDFRCTHILSNTVRQPMDVQAADLDGDGDLDVYFAGLQDDLIAWFQNEGAGVFGDYQVVSQFQLNGANSCQALDLDGDGDLDLVASSQFDDTVSWFPNLGAGVFGEEQNITIALDSPDRVHATDMDGDGDLDVFTISSLSDELYCMENLGGGVFAEEPVFIQNLGGPRQISSGDLDGDEDQDLIIPAYEEDGVLLLLNDGSGNFAPGVPLPVELNTVNTAVVEDLDGDGDLDILAAPLIGNELYAFYNDGQANFTAELLSATLSSATNFLALGDMDGNAQWDVVAGTINSNAPSIRWFDPTEDPEADASRPIADGLEGAEGFAWEDMDGDGLPDMVTYAQGRDELVWMDLASDQTTRCLHLIGTGLSTPESEAEIPLAVGDLNADGHPDVVVSNEIDMTLQYYASIGGGQFAPPVPLHTFSATGVSVTDIHIADVDADGSLDVLCVRQRWQSAGDASEDKVLWLENPNGGSTWEPHYLSEGVVNRPRKLVFTDLDLDGQEDIVISGVSDGTVWWCAGAGAGAFSNPQPIAPGFSAPENLLVVDINLDGRLDVVVSTAHSSPDLYMALNQGGDTFSVPLLIAEGLGNGGALIAADFDQDGDPDVITSHPYNTSVQVLENDGQGFFPLPALTSAAKDGSFIAYDYDQDGLLDILGLDGDRYHPWWAKNKSNQGCTDATACNYAAHATIEDGSCCYGTCGCTNPTAINYDALATCNSVMCQLWLNGHVFHDANNNGIWDDDELPLPFHEVHLPALGVIMITNDDGYFQTPIPSGIQTVDCQASDAFPFHTTDNPLVIDPDTDATTGLEFGLNNIEPDWEICMDFYPDVHPFLCNDWVNHNMCFRNMGNDPIDGYIKVTLDPLWQDFEEVTPIDSVVDGMIFMGFENLAPGEMFFYDINLLSPPVENIGEILNYTAEAFGFIDEEQVAYGIETLELEVLCAYDPNDKQVFPTGYTEDHLILNDTQLEYLIRFQNTGNAPATDVLLRDTLDANLDWTTFELVANSHSVITTLNASTREITFFFEDIMLPDSACCGEASKGLVSFRIRPLQGLEAGTELNNTAYIYFDNNPPIITNTTWSTIHTCADELELTQTSIPVCPGTGTELSSNYDMDIDWETSFVWELDGEDLGTDPTLVLPPTYSTEESFIFIATNPLCTEFGGGSFPFQSEFNWLSCPGDVNCDGVVDATDILAFLAEYACTGPLCKFDLDDNQTVDSADLLVVLGALGTECP